MMTIRRSIFVILPFILLTPFKDYGQVFLSKDLAGIELSNAAKEIMIAAGTCALITLDEAGRPRARAMDPFIPENDLTVWFGTNSRSRKVDQIKLDPRVTLYYLDSDASGYVMIHGTAQLVNDQKEKEKRWKDEWEAFYTDLEEAYLLIKVSPIWVEVSSTTRGIFGNDSTWQPPVVVFDTKLFNSE